IKYVETNKTYSVIKTKRYQVCCKGYEKVNEICEPICIGGCGHGECKSPGTCLCDKGWKGSKCTEECESGTYGLYCNSTCSCFNDGVCDKVNGTCLCPPGFIGLFCEQKCPLDFYGEDCESNCSCLNGAECDVHDGTCLCLAGYMGKQCESKCLEGKYGMKCMLSCTCNVDTTEFCRPIDGKCFCLPGYTGERCEQKCSIFHWGANCEKSCDCKKNTACDHITGQCFCPPGWQGAGCDKACPENKWGKDCNKSCSCNIGSCDPATGQCICLAGWMGDDCSTICPPGLFGLNCKNNCSCSNNATCNPIDGKCPCDAECREEILNMVWKLTGDHSSSTVSSTTHDERNKSSVNITAHLGFSTLGFCIIGVLLACYTVIRSKKIERVSKNQLSSENKNENVAEDTGSALCVRFTNHISEVPNISDETKQSHNNAGDYDMVLLNFERKDINTTSRHTKSIFSKPEAQRRPMKHNINKRNTISYTKELKSQDRNEKLYNFDSSDEHQKLKKGFIGRLQKSQSISYDDLKMHKKFSMEFAKESGKDFPIYFTKDKVERLIMTIENDSKFSTLNIENQGKKTKERKEEKKQEKKDLNSGIGAANFVEASDKPGADLNSCYRDYVVPQVNSLANEGVLCKPEITIKNENFPQTSDHGQKKNDKASESTLPTNNDVLKCFAIHRDRNVKSIRATFKNKPGKTEFYGSVADADCKTYIASNDVENSYDMMQEEGKYSNGKERKQEKALSEKENESGKENISAKLAI
ncbi:protein draper-like, partial [Stegodyphus dumicola]|uniref:protein draper-like n=1 Tax=Stegodyphus dumicola TaxID=202533 RepID=UPI0015AF105E